MAQEAAISGAPTQAAAAVDAAPEGEMPSAPVPSLVVKPFTTEVVKVVKRHREVGMASFYRLAGKTASGMPGGGMTAAHRKLPFGSKVRVKDMKTGREVLVTITDRGPFRKSRVIDLSLIAAKELGIIGRGIAKVELVSE